LGNTRNTLFVGQLKAPKLWWAGHCRSVFCGSWRATIGTLWMSMVFLISFSLKEMSWDLLALSAESMQPV